MNRIEQYQCLRAELPDMEDRSAAMTAQEQSFLLELLDLPEADVFLTPEGIEEIKSSLAVQKAHFPVKQLASFQTSSHWEQPQYIQKARRCLQILRAHQEFAYKNQTLKGTVCEGKGYPLYLQADVFTREWYLCFIDVERRIPVLVNLYRLEFGETMDTETLTEAERKQILKEQPKKELVLKVQNRYGAFDRAAALFSGYKREVSYDTEKNCLWLKLQYYDYEEHGLPSKVLSLGALAEVVESDEIRAAVRQVVDQALRLYEE